MSDFSDASARAFLLKLNRSHCLAGWWLLLHLLLIVAVAMAGVAMALRVAFWLVLGLHYWRRYPACPALLLVSPGGRFALPAEGRFDLELARDTRLGGFWVELVFGDRPDEPLLLLRDQFTVSGWRQLCIALNEWV